MRIVGILQDARALTDGLLDLEPLELLARCLLQKSAPAALADDFVDVVEDRVIEDDVSASHAATLVPLLVPH